MTATVEALAPVVMVTADGESRPAQMWGQDSYTCGFCESPVFGPVDWEQHERDNAEHYAKRGEPYTWEPYSYRARYWEARECANPGCVTALTGERLAQVRERQRREQERKDRDTAEKAREQAKRDAADARKARRAEILATVRPMGEQLGFAWACTHKEPATSYGADPVMCEASGWEREKYVSHMRGHGARLTHSAVKLSRLRKHAPAAQLPKLEVSPFKFIAWTEKHTEQATCKRCGHTAGEHEIRHGLSEISACTACECHTQASIYGDAFTKQPTQTAERRGQFWALGPDPHSVWVLPFEVAPWETRTQPVLLYTGQPGKFHTSAYSAKWDRR